MCEPENIDQEVTLEDIKEYYGKTLQSSKDLKTDVSSYCPLTASVPKHINDAIAEVHEEVSSRYFGCGVVLPPHVKGTRILDLGSGSGRDCYALSKLVGEEGHVTGIDMTEEMIDISSKYVKYHQEKFGYSKPNVTFVLGFMEQLEEAGIKPSSFDIIISNCVITLCLDKAAVFREAYKALKDGGEMFISDLYADQVVPDHIRTNKKLFGEGLGGALWWKDLLNITQDIGFCRPRLVDARVFKVFDKDVEKAVKGINYVAATYRIVKLSKGVVYQPCKATYLGNIIGYPNSLKLDANLSFEKGQTQLVDSTVAAILKTSRFNSCFKFDEIVTSAPVDPIKMSSGLCCKLDSESSMDCSTGDMECSSKNQCKIDDEADACCKKKSSISKECQQTVEPREKRPRRDCE